MEDIMSNHNIGGACAGRALTTTTPCNSSSTPVPTSSSIEMMDPEKRQRQQRTTTHMDQVQPVSASSMVKAAVEQPSTEHHTHNTLQHHNAHAHNTQLLPTPPSRLKQTPEEIKSDNAAQPPPPPMTSSPDAVHEESAGDTNDNDNFGFLDEDEEGPSACTNMECTSTDMERLASSDCDNATPTQETTNVVGNAKTKDSPATASPRNVRETPITTQKEESSRAPAKSSRSENRRLSGGSSLSLEALQSLQKGALEDDDPQKYLLIGVGYLELAIHSTQSEQQQQRATPTRSKTCMERLLMCFHAYVWLKKAALQEHHEAPKAMGYCLNFVAVNELWYGADRTCGATFPQRVYDENGNILDTDRDVLFVGEYKHHVPCHLGSARYFRLIKLCQNFPAHSHSVASVAQFVFSVLSLRGSRMLWSKDADCIFWQEIDEENALAVIQDALSAMFPLTTVCAVTSELGAYFEKQNKGYALSNSNPNNVLLGSPIPKRLSVPGSEPIHPSDLDVLSPCVQNPIDLDVVSPGVCQQCQQFQAHPSNCSQNNVSAYSGCDQQYCAEARFAHNVATEMKKTTGARFLKQIKSHKAFCDGIWDELGSTEAKEKIQTAFETRNAAREYCNVAKGIPCNSIRPPVAAALPTVRDRISRSAPSETMPDGAAANDSDAQFLLGCQYSSGNEGAGKPDLFQAYYWLYQAAQRGHSEAASKLESVMFLVDRMAWYSIMGFDRRSIFPQKEYDELNRVLGTDRDVLLSEDFARKLLPFLGNIRLGILARGICRQPGIVGKSKTHMRLMAEVIYDMISRGGSRFLLFESSVVRPTYETKFRPMSAGLAIEWLEVELMKQHSTIFSPNESITFLFPPMTTCAGTDQVQKPATWTDGTKPTEPQEEPQISLLSESHLEHQNQHAQQVFSPEFMCRTEVIVELEWSKWLAGNTFGGIPLQEVERAKSRIPQLKALLQSKQFDRRVSDASSYVSMELELLTHRLNSFHGSEGHRWLLMSVIQDLEREQQREKQRGCSNIAHSPSPLPHQDHELSHIPLVEDSDSASDLSHLHRKRQSSAILSSDGICGTLLHGTPVSKPNRVSFMATEEEETAKYPLHEQCWNECTVQHDGIGKKSSCDSKDSDASITLQPGSSFLSTSGRNGKKRNKSHLQPEIGASSKESAVAAKSLQPSFSLDLSSLVNKKDPDPQAEPVTKRRRPYLL